MIERVVEDRVAEALTLSASGEVYFAIGEQQKALDSYTQSLLLFQVVQDPLGEGRALVNLMEYWKSLQNPSLAVLFGKQAIDRFQQVRRNIGGLDKVERRSFLKSKEDYYRELAELLILQGRLVEAQRVLDLLKEEEYSDFTHRRGDTGSETNPVALTAMEEKSKKEYEDITDNITAIGSEWMQLRSKSPRSATEDERYSDLNRRLTAANLRFETFLKALYKSFGKDDQANERVKTIEGETAEMQALVGEPSAGTTVVYTLVLDEKCELIVITGRTRVHREKLIGKVALREKVFELMQALTAHFSEAEIQAKALDLYDILIAPIEKDLQGAQANTLVWSLDDQLRYVPLAALYDGKQYLVERYRNVVITTTSVGDLKDPPRVNNWRGLAMGVSKNYDGLGELRAVPDELDAIVRSAETASSHGPVPGTILLNDAFTLKSMETELEQHPPLVHIASHYVFQPGDDTKSYLLLGGKETGGQGFHLTLADLENDPSVDFTGVDLLTLAGCQTALGSKDSDGREIDSLGITAQRKGAKAVMASLWAVDDPSVGLLMATFYKLWISTPGITKAEALRQAQLKFLHGTSGPTEVYSRERGVRLLGSSAANSSASASEQSPAFPYANPYYWAPFILIGNWK
jgi:CHAT domain-containing protein